MTSAQPFLDDMQERFKREPRRVWSLSLSDIQPYCGHDAQAVQGFFNAVGMLLAQGYAAGVLSFGFCDALANGLWLALLEREPQAPWPDLFYDTYIAFDTGEYQHAGDAADVDPIKTYTDPYIAWILSNYSSADQPSPVRGTGSP